MFFHGLPGGSSGGQEGDPAVFGWVFVVLFWSFVLTIVGGLLGLIFWVGSMIDGVGF